VSSFIEADAEVELSAALTEWLSKAVCEAQHEANVGPMVKVKAATQVAPGAARPSCTATDFASFCWRHGPLEIDGKLCNTVKPLAAFLHTNGYYALAEPRVECPPPDEGGFLGEWICGGRRRSLGRPGSPGSPSSYAKGKNAGWFGAFSRPMKTVRFAPMNVVVVDGSEVEIEAGARPETGALLPAATPVVCGSNSATNASAPPIAPVTTLGVAPPPGPGRWRPFEAWTGRGPEGATHTFGTWDHQLKVSLKRFLNDHVKRLLNDRDSEPRAARDAPRASHTFLNESDDEWNAEAIGALQRFLNANGHVGEVSLDVSGRMSSKPLEGPRSPPKPPDTSSKPLEVSGRMGLFGVAMFGVSEADPTVAALQRFLNGQMA